MTSAMTRAGLTEGRVEGLRVFTGGSGRPVALVHGLGGSAANWVDVVPDLAASHRVLAVDLPGHGRSERPPHGSTVDDFASRLAAVLDAENAGPAIVAGHSFGGLVALRLALRRPDRVAGLLLVSPAGIRTRTRALQILVTAAGIVRPGRLAARFAPRQAEKLWFRRAAFRPFFVADPCALSARATGGLLEGQREHTDTRTAGRAMLADDPRADLAGVSCPALVLWGACDRQLPVDDAFEYARRLGARLRVVADCGHLLIAERPDAVLDGIRDLDVLVRDRETLG